MEFFDKLMQALPFTLTDVYSWFVNQLPSIFIATIVIIIGYFAAMLSGFIIKKILYKVKLDKQIRRADLHDSIGQISLAKLFGKITKWYVFILFLQPAVGLVDAGIVSELIGGLVAWLPRLILAIVILIFGLLGSDYLMDRLFQAKTAATRIVSKVVKVFLIFIVVFIALNQLGINLDIAEKTYLILLASSAFGLAITMGISFGFALKEDAAKIVKQARKK